MTNSNQRYDVQTTLFCGAEFKSVRVDGLDYYPIKEIGKIDRFQLCQDNILRDIKALLGKDSNYVNVATNLAKRKVNCINHSQLSRLVMLLARKKNNDYAWDLLEASFDVMLRAANDSTYGRAEKVAYYVELAAMRAEGIKYRRLFTDVIKMQNDLGYDLNYGLMTLLVYTATELIEKYNAWTIVYTTQSDKRKNPFRGTLNQLELKKLNDFELRCAERALSKKQPIIQAVRDTTEFFS